jgi:UDP-2,4-diacetamido-2,4,6-trideoxy-beta-L-altropyranose hydrolase
MIRADASPTVGTGHVMRCLALAQAAQAEGIGVRIAGRITVPWVQERLERENIPVTIISGDIPAWERPEDLITQIGGTADWIVLDGYHFGPDCQKTVRGAGCKLLVVDDYCHLPGYDCDILLNQNLGSEMLPYAGRIGQKLLGPRYALLRPEFAAARNKAEKRVFPEKARNLLLTLGGGDFSGHLKRLAPDFAIPELRGCTLRVIAGAMPEKTIRHCLKQCPADVEILSRVDNMPDLLLRTDLCITAGGSTCWELCCLGVPFLTIKVAKNQKNIIECLDNQGLAQQFNDINFSTFFNNAEKRKFTAEIIRNLVNGYGAYEAIKFMDNIDVKSFCIDKKLSIQLHTIQAEHENFIFYMANDRETRIMSFKSHFITREEHSTWFNDQLRNNIHFYIAYYNNEPCGYVRFNRECDDVAISVAVAREFRGRGIGHEMIQSACQMFLYKYKDTCIYAYIKSINIASIQTFKKAGFIPVKQECADIILLKYLR